MDGQELRERVKALGWTYTEAAKLLGMSLPGLQHNMRGERPVGRQTKIILELREKLTQEDD